MKQRQNMKFNCENMATKEMLNGNGDSFARVEGKDVHIEKYLSLPFLKMLIVKQVFRTDRFRTISSCLAIAFALVTASSQLSAQIRAQVLETEVVTKRVDEKTAKENEEKYAGGGTLKTDSDLEDSLKRASAFVAEKNYRFAATLWDRVLEASDNSLITEDGETYVSLVSQVEQTIRNLPPNGLQVYRISADGKARALLSGPPEEAKEESLAKLVRLYFMSSVGDDAAFELGCRALDRRDFVAASRMFGKILTEHPDPSIKKVEVLARVAIAAGNLGDFEAAEKAIEAAAAESEGTTKVLVSNVQQHLEYIKSNASGFANVGESISMRLGNMDRSGVMPDLPPETLSGDLTQGYEFRFPYKYENKGGPSDLGQIIRGAGTNENPDASVATLTKKWRESKWLPANQLLFANNRLVVKSTNDVVCIDASGQSELPLWHSLWLNHFELDDASWNSKNFNGARNGGGQIPITLPKDEKESLFFHDKIHHSMAIHNGIVFTIEGKNYSQLDDSIPRTRKPTVQKGFGQPVNLSRSRTNYLSAYSLRTGKVLWTRSAFEKPETKEGEAEDTSESRVGFLGTPVPFGNLVLCPVTEGGAVFVYAMDVTKKGKTVWKTFLCDDPAVGVDLFAPVEITVAGQEAYVTCGSGVLFALNAATGNIQFARRYTRDGKKKNYQVSYNQKQDLLDLAGWDDNVVVAWKNALIVMASDHDDVFAVDRRNGKFLWAAPRLPFVPESSHAYYLGFHDDKLFMATDKSVLSYSLSGEGKLHQHRLLGGHSYGRGFITSKAVYMPVEDSIVKLNLDTLKVEAQVGVNLGAEDKVGNIYSDGKQIWVVGINRVVGLRSLRDRLAELTQLVDSGDRSALEERITIYAKLNEYSNTISDAKKLLELAGDDKPKVLSSVFDILKTSSTNKNSPKETLAFLNDLIVSSNQEEAVLKVINANAVMFFDTAKSLAKSGDPEAMQTILGWCSLPMTSEFKTNIVNFLTANPPPSNALSAVLKQSDEATILMLLPIAAKLDDSKDVLTLLLETDSEKVLIETADLLAKSGEKSCLQVAFGLLKSKDVGRRTRANLILKRFTKAEVEFKPSGTEEERNAGIDAWKKWLEENESDVPSGMSVDLIFDQILVSTASNWISYSAENPLKKLSSFQVAAKEKTSAFFPEDITTSPSGNPIVCSFRQQTITEYDLEKNVVSTLKLKNPPRSARVLESGNYLVAWYSKNPAEPGVVELDKSGKVVWQTKGLIGEARCAERLSNGRTLIAYSNRVVEIDADSAVYFELSRAQKIANCNECRRLENGNTLVAYGSTVAEFDTNKNLVMKVTTGSVVRSAVRLDDGRTVVGDTQGLRVFDKDGKKIDELININNVNSVWHY